MEPISGSPLSILAKKELNMFRPSSIMPGSMGDTFHKYKVEHAAFNILVLELQFLELPRS